MSSPVDFHIIARRARPWPVQVYWNLPLLLAACCQGKAPVHFPGISAFWDFRSSIPLPCKWLYSYIASSIISYKLRSIWFAIPGSRQLVGNLVHGNVDAPCAEQLFLKDPGGQDALICGFLFWGTNISTLCLWTFGALEKADGEWLDSGTIGVGYDLLAGSDATGKNDDTLVPSGPYF